MKQKTRGSNETSESIAPMLMTIMRATAVVTRDREPLLADDHRSRLFGISIETI